MFNSLSELFGLKRTSCHEFKSANVFLPYEPRTA